MASDQIFIIAEIGINHNGNLDQAMRLIDIAAACGCDAVKFQKRTIDLVYPPDVLAQPRESPWGTTTREQKEGLEFGAEEYDAIDQHCGSRKIEWLASAWDIPSQRFLGRYGVHYNKIASAMLTHLEFVECVALERKPTFVSTGMCELGDIDNAVEVLQRRECPFVLMHAVSTYPCRDEDCNVLMVRTLKERYGCRVGYSGHEVGLLPSVLAVALGAEVIERHITLDRAMYGSDQAASLEKRGLELLVRDCRSVRDVLGAGTKAFEAAERAVAKKLRYFAHA